MDNSDRVQRGNNQVESTSIPKSILAVKWSYRWEVFRRLKTLGVECQCSTNEPLLVNLRSPTTIIQIWSVLRQFNLSRHELINWLDNCWEIQDDGLERVVNNLEQDL